AEPLDGLQRSLARAPQSSGKKISTCAGQARPDCIGDRRCGTLLGAPMRALSETLDCTAPETGFDSSKPFGRSAECRQRPSMSGVLLRGSGKVWLSRAESRAPRISESTGRSKAP